MREFKEFRVVALHDHNRFRVEVKGFFGWRCGTKATEYFCSDYRTEDRALKAVALYKTRITEC